jgi:polar amino acid transport system substrate-binding protein
MFRSRTRAPAVAAAAMLALAMAAMPAVAQETAEPDGHLARVLEAGVIVTYTDPIYPPQSELAPDGTFQGFDIDVATEIARRLGVEVGFVTPAWEVITAGNWGGRLDFAVASMTITSPRQEVLEFTRPYYYTPAQLAARADLGYDSPEDLAGQTICVGAATTYVDWLAGTLDFGTETPQSAPPEGAVATTLPTDRLCAEAWRAGRRDFEGWLSSAATVQAAIDEGLPVTALGDPVFYEPLAVAFDRSVVDSDSLVAAVDAILGEMHEDGTLTAFSLKWYGADLTRRADEP